jgi:uncharacterized protein (TIGR02246 family)
VEDPQLAPDGAAPGTDRGHLDEEDYDMRSLQIGLVVAFALVASFGFGQGDDAEVGAAIDALAAKYEEGWSAGDASVSASIYAQDAVSVDLFGATYEGRAAIEESIAATIESYGASTIDITRTSLYRVNDNIVVSDGTWQVTGSTAEGAPTQGFYTIVAVDSGGAWLISQAQSKVTPPMMPSE